MKTVFVRFLAMCDFKDKSFEIFSSMEKAREHEGIKYEDVITNENGLQECDQIGVDRNDNWYFITEVKVQ